MDRIGPFLFIRLDRPPARVQTEWELAARAGIAGVALWDTGARGEPFTVNSEAVAVNFASGRTYLQDYLTLVDGSPVPIWFGTLEPQQIYKVLRVELVGPGVKAVPRVHLANDPTWYTALVFAQWTLLPVDPFVGPPE